jgi:hypothetical protein
MAARVGHHVDRGRAAQHLAAHRLDTAIVEIRFRLGVKAPIVQHVLVHLAHAERNRDERIDVAAAGFEQQYRGVGILAQPIGEHAAGRSRAHDHIIVALLRHSSPSSLACLFL